MVAFRRRYKAVTRAIVGAVTGAVMASAGQSHGQVPNDAGRERVKTSPERAKIRIKRFRSLKLTKVILPRGAATKRHFHGSDFIVRPKKSGTIRIVVYDSKDGDTVVREEVKRLTAGKPYHVKVRKDGVWQEVCNDGPPIEFDKDEPDPKRAPKSPRRQPRSY
jgi:hypothetical protein